MNHQDIAKPIRKLARITAKPGHGDQLRAALLELEAATRQELGCIEFSFFQAISDPDAFVLLEHFADEHAFKLHMTLEHTRSFFGTNAERVAGIKAVDIPSFESPVTR